jgi:hypothetical protein
MTGFIIFIVIMIIFWVSRTAAKTKGNNPNARAQKLLERIQAQQAGNQPVKGQYTQPTSGQSLPGQPTGRAQTSAQLAGMLQQLLQSGQQPNRGQYSAPGQQTPPPGQYGGQVTQPGYTPPGQFQPPQQQYAGPQQNLAAQPIVWAQQYQQGPPQYQQAPQGNRPLHGRPPAHNVPAPNSPLEKRIRELMTTGNEVSAIRLLCDEQDLGIIEAQEYARGLVAPARKAATAADPDGTRSDAVEEETRYVGSAAFAESVFDLDRDENVWASGWVEKPEPEDRTDMDELWQSVRNAGRPPNPAG